MAQHALTDGELLRKTLRTTLVMVGTTALWLGALSGIVLAMTGSPASSGAGESKADKAIGSAPGAASGAAPGTLPLKGPLGPAGFKTMHRMGPGLQKSEVPQPGDTKN